MRTKSLKELVERARQRELSPADVEEHRRSFAYANLRLDDPTVTRA